VQGLQQEMVHYVKKDAPNKPNSALSQQLFELE